MKRQEPESHPKARPGPRFSRDEAVPRMRAVARCLIEEEGASDLSFRKVASDPEPRVSYSAPPHHFGSNAGMLAAVACEVFEELTAALKGRRESQPPTLGALNELELCLAGFALKQPLLYQAAHAPELWQVITELPDSGEERVDEKESRRKSREREEGWLQGALRTRDDAFGEFLMAARDAMASGETEEESHEEPDVPSLVAEPRFALTPALATPDPEDVARIVTALVNGYLTQLWNERAAPDESPLEDVGRLLRLALTGLL